MKNLIGFLLILCCSSLSAQQKLEGFIVKTSGDTIRGFITEHYGWTKVSTYEISSSPTAESTKIPADEVDNFYLKNYDSYLLRRELDIDKKPIETSRLETNGAKKVVREIVVIRLLLKGKVSLYDYVDETAKKHFFIQKDDGKIEELSYVRYLALNGTYLVEQPFFVEQLSFLTECKAVKRISKSYIQSSLEKEISLYNSCFSTEQYKGKKVKNAVSVSVFAGGGFCAPTYKGIDQVSDVLGVEAGTADYTTTTSITAGANIDLISGRKSRVVPGLQIGYVKTGRVEAEREFITSRRDIWMDLSMAYTVLTCKYLIVNRENWKIHAKGGVGIQYLLSSTAKWTSTDFNFNTTTTPADFTTYKKQGYTYTLGVGASFNRLNVGLDFIQNIAPAKITGQGIANSLALTVGYRLTKK